MSDAVLTVLKFCLLALLYLFLLRVVWIVARELRGTPVRAPVPASAAPSAPPPPRPRARSRWRLVVLKPDTEKGHEYPVDGELTVGRGGGCTVRLLSDTFVSQVHARITDRDGTLWIEDAGSTNGTFVNEKRIDNPMKLKRGDRVRVGQTTLEAER
jgi:hypothetical protein